jgi:hypothetical protein
VDVHPDGGEITVHTHVPTALQDVAKILVIATRVRLECTVTTVILVAPLTAQTDVVKTTVYVLDVCLGGGELLAEVFVVVVVVVSTARMVVAGRTACVMTVYVVVMATHAHRHVPSV